MKRIYIPLMLSAVLSLGGCGTETVMRAENSSSEAITQEYVTTAAEETEETTETAQTGTKLSGTAVTSSAAETTTVTAAAEAAEEQDNDVQQTYPVPVGADPEEIMSHYSFSVTQHGVEVYYDGKKVQLIPENGLYSENASHPLDDFLVHEDFDFDLYDDLFIPSSVGDISDVSGRYYHFDRTVGLFAEWSELDRLGRCAETNPADGTLMIHNKDSAAAYEDKYYSWDSGTLVLVMRVVQYVSTNGEMYIDYYEVKGGSEELFYRERILFGVDGSYAGTESVPLG
ncbi:MAG: hypothetical protein IJ874_05180 [Ruminococcus sp.]|nr:hypothetical protein [Ruminococcus sp.]